MLHVIGPESPINAAQQAIKHSDELFQRSVMSVMILCSRVDR